MAKEEILTRNGVLGYVTQGWCVNIPKKCEVQGEAAGEQTKIRQISDLRCASRSPGGLLEAQSSRPYSLGVSDSEDLE